MRYPKLPHPTYATYSYDQQQSQEAVPANLFGRRRRRIDSPADVVPFLLPFLFNPYNNFYPTPYYQPYYPPYYPYPYDPYAAYQNQYPYQDPYQNAYPYSPYVYAGAEQNPSAQPVMAEPEDQENEENDELV